MMKLSLRSVAGAIVVVCCSIYPNVACATSPQGLEVVDPKDSSCYVSVWTNGTAGISFAISKDSGTTWDTRTLDLPSEFSDTASPMAVVDLKGRIHITFAANTTDQESLWHRGGIFVLTSVDKGKTFKRLVQIAHNSTSGVNSSPYIACDRDEQSPFRNHVYVAWVLEIKRTDGSKSSQIMFTKSVNGGNTFFVTVPGPASAPNGEEDNGSNTQDIGVSFQTLLSMRLSVGRNLVSDPKIEVEDSKHLKVSWTDEETAADQSVRNRHVTVMSANGGMSFGRETRELID